MVPPKSALVRRTAKMTEEEMQARILELENEVTKAKADKSTAIGEKTRAKNELKELEDRINDLEAAKNEAVDSSKSEAEKATTALQRQITKLQTDLAESAKREATFRIDGAIAERIAKEGVLPDMVPLVTAFLKAGAEMKNGEAMVNGIPLTEHADAYFTSTAARAVVAAPANSGGNAQGSSAKASGFTKAPETQEEFERFMKLTIDNPSQASALADQWGMPELKPTV